MTDFQQGVLIGAMSPFVLVFVIRAIKLVPSVIRDTLSAIWNLVKNTKVHAQA